MSGASTGWNYDSKSRLTNETAQRYGGENEAFGYDPSGNPTTFKGSAQTFNVDNQLNAGGYVFDGNGNPSTYAGSSMKFDPENRLVDIGSSQSTAYRLDGLRAYLTSGSTRTYYLYDRGEPVVEMNSSGQITAVNVLADDGLVARKQSGSWIYYNFDQQGNVAQRTNSTGAILSSSVYDAYGVESTTGTPTDPFGYNARWGYYLDRATGLYLCQHRYFDPAQGRWLNRDPIRYFGGLNIYSYCLDGPESFFDPSGAITACVGLGVIGGIPFLGAWANADICYDFSNHRFGTQLSGGYGFGGGMGFQAGPEISLSPAPLQTGYSPPPDVEMVAFADDGLGGSIDFGMNVDPLDCLGGALFDPKGKVSFGAGGGCYVGGKKTLPYSGTHTWTALF